jgi:hypothetical protein
VPGLPLRRRGPARLAACFASMVPSSGISTNNAIAVAAPMPGMLNKMSSRALSVGFAARMDIHSRSMASI